LKIFLHAKEEMMRGGKELSMIWLFSISSWTSSPPCVNQGDNSSDEEIEEHELFPSQVDELRMIGHTR